MHAIDSAILTGTLTAGLLAAAAREPLPVPGASYWADHLRAGRTPELAARLAARDMGAVLTSLRALRVAAPIRSSRERLADIRAEREVVR